MRLVIGCINIPEIDKKSAYKEKFYKDLGFIATFKYLGFKTKKLIQNKSFNMIMIFPVIKKL